MIPRPKLILAVLALFVLLERLHCWHEPMNRDLGDYATVGHEMHCGKQLYADLPDQKPPGIHVTYYLAEAVAGYGPAQIYLMAVAAALITLAGTYVATVCFTGNGAAGLWAAAFWAVICGDLLLEANQPNAEVFMNAFGMAGIAAMAVPFRRKSGWWPIVAAGICFSAATLYKQVIFTVPILLGLGYVLAPPPGRSRGRAVIEMGVLGGIIAAIWGATFGYFALQGHLGAFLHWVFEYNRRYAGDLGANLGQLLPNLLPECLRAAIPLAVLALAGIAIDLFRGRWQPALLLGLLAVGTALAIALPGRFSPHYYQLWLPWLVTGAGCGVAALESATGSRQLSIWVGAVTLAAVAAFELPNYFLPAEEWSHLKYNRLFIETNAIGAQIRKDLLPGETFFQLADEAELYAVTGMRPPSRFIGVAGFTDPLEGRALRTMAVRELDAAKPDLILADLITLLLLEKVDDRELLPYVTANYRPVSRQYLRFLYYVRKRSALDKRWEAGKVIHAPS